MLNIFSKVSNLPSLLAVNFTKVEIWIIQIVTLPHVSHFIKGSCLGVSYTTSAPCLVWCPYIFCRWRYVFFLSHDPTRSFYWRVTHIYWWELPQQVTSPKGLMAIGILIVEEKCFIKNMNLINMCLTNRQEKKWYSLKNVNYEKKCAKRKKNYFFP